MDLARSKVSMNKDLMGVRLKLREVTKLHAKGMCYVFSCFDMCLLIKFFLSLYFSPTLINFG